MKEKITNKFNEILVPKGFELVGIANENFKTTFADGSDYLNVHYRVKYRLGENSGSVLLDAEYLDSTMEGVFKDLIKSYNL